MRFIMIVAALIIGIPVMFYIYNSISARFDSPPAYIEEASKVIEEREEAFKEAIKVDQPYDLDQTVMALYSIEKAASEATSFEELTQFVLQKDSTLIAPEVQQLKFKFFAAYKDLLRTQDEIDELDSIFKVTSDTLLTIASMMDTSLVSFNRSQSQKVWERRVKQEDLEHDLHQRLGRQQDVFINFLFEFQTLSAKYYRDWDQLCAFRDRAYLAIHEGNLDEAKKNAAAAVAHSPYEKEAHILLAMCLLEGSSFEISPEKTKSNDAEMLIDHFLKKHQGQQAPGHLLKGVINMAKGDIEAAKVDFDQAAAYYPKQQEVLNNQLNLYKKRAFLNSSREGRVIVNMYRGMMCGSGYFSPDFQKARLHLEQKRSSDAKTKIFDHFFRRRMQGQWDRVLNDYHYAKQFLEDENLDFNKEEELNLQIDSTMFTNSVTVTVKNSGDTDIHNATILLCVRFTDMFPGDFVSFPVGETKALLAAQSEAYFGKRHLGDIAEEKLGMEKEFKDIIEYAAVLISDEVITWVEPQDVKEIKEEVVTVSTDGLKTSTTKVINTTTGAITDKAQQMLDSVSKAEVNTLVDKALEAIKNSVMNAAKEN